jgi:hypothetical protein
MCHQSVGLIQSIIEKAAFQRLPLRCFMRVTERVDPPRTLLVDRQFGYPLGAPNDAPLQTVIITAMLALLKEHVPPAVRWNLEAAG